MKRIICLFLCLSMALCVLVGCGETKIGDYLKNYDYKPTVIEDLTMEVWLIGGESDDNALTTVTRMLNQYTESKFHTTLNLHYIRESEYDTQIRAALSNPNTKVDILLINSKELMDTLMAQNKLCDLTAYFASGTYGVLNTRITSSLLRASAVQTAGQSDLSYFCVPNNRVIGSYSYVLIQKEKARRLNYSDVALAAMTDYEKTKSLRDDIAADSASGKTDPDEFVKFLRGSYADKAHYESEGWFCNIAEYPTVTKAQAYQSAFAIMADTKDANRAMEILYAINMDATLRNMLQYGVKNTNYTEENGVVTRVTSEGNRYDMNLLYTGDIFTAYYCTDPALGWTPQIGAYAKAQNDQSSFIGD